MLLSALALSVGLATSPLSSAHTAIDVVNAEPTVVYLGCQVRATALTDCKVVNDDPVDAATAAAALKLAADMTVPAALAERNPGHIVVKLTVKR